MYPKLPPGSPVTAFSISAYNDMLDMLQRDSAARRGGTHPLLRNTGIVRVKNDSGADVSWLGVLGIDAPLYTPTDNLDEFKSRVILSCDTPDIDDHPGKWCVAAGAIADGEMGLAFVSGVCPAIINVVDAAHPCVDIADADDELNSGWWGAGQILWQETGTGSGKRALIRIGNPPVSGPVFWGKLDGTLSQGGSATVSLWTGSGASLSDSGKNVTAYDALLGSGDTLASGVMIKIEYFPAPYATWYVTAAGCS